MNKKSSRNKKKRFHSGRIIVTVILSILALWYINNLTLKSTYVDITSKKLSSEIKIALISDLHNDRISVNPEKVKNRILRENPDLIFVLGDMYSNGSSREIIEKTNDFIISLAKINPVYFVSGEHDNDVDFLRNLKKNNVNVMDYKCQKIWIEGNQLEIYGIDNAYFSETFDLKNEFQPPEKNVYSILLAHIPMYKYYQNFGADLTLCGDTHGGIVQIPFVGCAYYENQWFPEMYRSSEDIYDKGLFSYIGGYMFITSGLGNYPVPARFNNRPEVAFITVSPSDK